MHNDAFEGQNEFKVLIWNHRQAVKWYWLF